MYVHLDWNWKAGLNGMHLLRSNSVRLRSSFYMSVRYVCKIQRQLYFSKCPGFSPSSFAVTMANLQSLLTYYIVTKTASTREWHNCRFSVQLSTELWNLWRYDEVRQKKYRCRGFRTFQKCFHGYEERVTDCSTLVQKSAHPGVCSLCWVRALCSCREWVRAGAVGLEIRVTVVIFTLVRRILIWKDKIWHLRYFIFKRFLSELRTW
jgi:hypothetical protein